MTPFVYHNGVFRAEWDAFEVTVFAAMARAVIDTIQKGDKTDSVYRKLFPPASRDDVVATEFSRLVQNQISDAKLHSLKQFNNMLTASLLDLPDAAHGIIQVVVTPDAAATALQALTAIRVYLGQKLEVTDDKDMDLLYHLVGTEAFAGENATPEKSEQVFLANVLFAAGFVQETLVGALSERLGNEPD